MSKEYERLRKRAKAIGDELDEGALPELQRLLHSPSPRVRRAAASAMGKLAERRRDVQRMVVFPLFVLGCDEEADQVREYALKALVKCAGEMSTEMVKELRDVARNAALKPYVRNAANEAVAAGEKTLRGKAVACRRLCARCYEVVTRDEAEKAMMRYGKVYCQHCFDERSLEEVSFEKTVEGAKRLRTSDRVAVQSRGEQRIGNWLAAKGIRYVYDARYRIVAEAELRPDFFLPEFDIYIEYWGMDTAEYLARKQAKLLLYQRAGKRLISLGPSDLPRLEAVLAEKLSRYIALPKDCDRSAVSRPSDPAAFIPPCATILPHPAPARSYWLK